MVDPLEEMARTARQVLGFWDALDGVLADDRGDAVQFHDGLAARMEDLRASAEGADAFLREEREAEDAEGSEFDDDDDNEEDVPPWMRSS